MSVHLLCLQNTAPITQKEKIKEIGIGLLLALIFAPALGGIVQLLFQWGAGFFDPAPNTPPDCKFSDFFDGSVGASEAYQACKDQSNSFPIRMERFSDKTSAMTGNLDGSLCGASSDISWFTL